MSETYSNEAVQEILREATLIQKDGDLSPAQLQEIAAEIGISPATLKKAKQVWREQQQTRQNQIRKRNKFIKFHLAPYLSVSFFLVMLNLVTSPQELWSVYPILGWGLGVGLDGTRLILPSNEDKKIRSIYS